MSELLWELYYPLTQPRMHIYIVIYIVTSIIYIKVVFWGVQGASLSGRLPPLAAFDHKGDTKMGVKRTQRGPGLIVDAN